MTLKTFLLGLLLAMFAAVMTAGLVVFGNAWLNDKPDGPVRSMLSRSAQEKDDMEFVEIKNLVVTLKNDQGRERYLLLELGLGTAGEQQKKRVENYIPVIRGTTVDVLSAMTYAEARNLSVGEIRELLMENYQKSFERNDRSLPFEKVIISKLVFQ
ncbi:MULTISPECIES: flagellar basal body-associated protein FliL [Rahnella]|uniref:Flagellar protein FliL n=1 Tax=Rahnella laticis TaxID=2787622 RepID=A0ABS0E587_9GAMM|nr:MULTISPECIES: flagellar basal body-associated FliL family protein [Rahnella]MBF7978449.1 flagellar basal body-associated FliL family protein [Rahnella laticis]MBF7995266.1 flagellar basal body-associated FliL family protein [Rahnella laticis]MBF7998539.1 flagellar basal body-associated FliL family protein [Rahnella sp. LAC-M12]